MKHPPPSILVICCIYCLVVISISHIRIIPPRYAMFKGNLCLNFLQILLFLESFYAIVGSWLDRRSILLQIFFFCKFVSRLGKVPPFALPFKTWSRAKFYVMIFVTDSPIYPSVQKEIISRKESAVNAAMDSFLSFSYTIFFQFLTQFPSK